MMTLKFLCRSIQDPGSDGCLLTTKCQLSICFLSIKWLFVCFPSVRCQFGCLLRCGRAALFGTIEGKLDCPMSCCLMTVSKCVRHLM